jgi:hypothetical protein
MKKFLLLLITLISKNIYPVELEHAFNLRTGVDINGTFGVRFLNEGKYELTLDKHWQLSPGFLLAPGWSFLSAYHLEAGYDKLFTEPLSIHVKFLNRSYHEISVAENSIISYLSWRDKYFEADFGINERFTNFGPKNLDMVFYYPDDLIQPFIVFRIAGYLVFENPAIRVGFEIKNNDWNYAANSFELSLGIDGAYQMTEALSLKLNLGTTPSGISGLSIFYNRYTFLVGAQYKL